MNPKILFATLATLLAAGTLWAQPINLRPYGTSPDTSGQDQQNNIGSIVTDPATTSAPLATKNAPIIAPAATDRALPGSSGYVRKRDEIPSEQPMSPENKLQTQMPESMGGQVSGTQGQQQRPEQQTLPAHP